MLDQAKRLDPFLPDYCREGEAVSHYLLERDADVLEVNALFRRLTRRAAVYGAAAAVHGAKRLRRRTQPRSFCVSIRSSGSACSLSLSPIRTRVMPSD